MQRFKCIFGMGRERIEIEYWFVNGQTTGEAYFVQDDYCAKIVDGMFSGLYGTEYAFYPPLPHSKLTDATLDVRRWCNVGRAVPTAAD